MLDRVALRKRANLVNLSTPLGLALAKLGRAQLSPWPDGIIIASEHRLPYPPAPAFTVGNVVLVRCTRAELDHQNELNPELMKHECRHASQYALCLGPALIPLYVAACGWSWMRTGDWWSRNTFERRAGLAEGGYREQPVRSLRRRSPTNSATHSPLQSA